MADFSKLAGLAGLGGTDVKVNTNFQGAVNSVINNIPGTGSSAGGGTGEQTADQTAKNLSDQGADLPTFGSPAPSPRPNIPNVTGGGGGLSGVFDSPLVIIAGVGAGGFILFQQFFSGRKKKKRGRK